MFFPVNIAHETGDNLVKFGEELVDLRGDFLLFLPCWSYGVMQYLRLFIYLFV